MGEGLTVEQAAIKQLQSLLEAQTKLRRVAEKRARDAEAALNRLAEGLAPAEVDRLRQESIEGLSVLSPKRIADLVLSTTRRRISQLESAASVDPDRLRSLQERIVELEQHVREAEARRPRAAAPTSLQPSSPTPPSRREETKKAKPSASSALAARPHWMTLPRPAPSTPAIPTNTWPGWAQKWRGESGNWSRDVDVIIILGDTGIARREDVDQILAEWWGISPGSGSIGRAIIRVREVELVEAIPSRRGRGRYPRHLLRLTQRGQDIYRFLRGEAPAPSQTTELLKRHKSPEHAALNLDAANRLWEAGYAVELFPDKVKLDKGTYYPDLVITTPEGKTLYVECERNTRKNPEERERKWALYHEASGGLFLVVTYNEEARETIKKEILTWVGERPLTLWMASIEGRETGLEWVEVR